MSESTARQPSGGWKLLRTGPIRIVPHGRDVYNRLLADVFVNEQNVAKILKMEGFAKSG